jgi:hypothetical protein
MTKDVSRWAAAAFAGAMLLSAPVAKVAAAELTDPPVFASAGGVLDLVIVATTEPIRFSPFHATGWIYHVCPRTAPDQMDCPASSTVWYGG